jgi:integrating conjugative element protein (TIGR03756 family)
MRTGLLLAVLLSALQLPQTTRAASLTTAEIVAQTSAAALACMQWRPVGLCFWLECEPLGCTVNSSLKVGHYNPDLVVSAYNTLGGNPWTEMRATLGAAQQAAAQSLLGRLLSVPVDSAGNRTEGTHNRLDHRNLLFRETDAIGHPLNLLSGAAGTGGLFCPSQAMPFVPYFQSGLDALAWRLAIPEMLYPASLIPGLREVGHWPLQTWGNVYPRTGWTTQAEEPKGAAINAQRAGDIVTRTGQPHVYLPLTGPFVIDQRVWPPGPLVEGNARTGTWQMLAPRPENSCAVFGSNDLFSAVGWGGGRVDPGGDYAWTLWRPYQCCQREGQVFITDINWTSFP